MLYRSFFRKILLMACGMTIGSVAFAQVALNTDGSAPAPFSIFSVKGSSGIALFINDTSGHVGISTLNAIANLTIQGNLKLQTPVNGTATDYLASWSPSTGTFNFVNTLQVATGPKVFEYEDGVINNSPGTLWQDDFVFGSDQLNFNSNPLHYSRIIFDKGKSAFRAGFVDNQRWDADSLGLYSTGFGNNVIAEATGSTAIGNNSKATGSYSFAIGNYAIASGSASLALGNHSKSNATYGIALGDSCETGHTASLAMGKLSRALSAYSVAIGENNLSSFQAAMTIGKDNQSSSNDAAVFGLQNIETGGRGFTSGFDNAHAGFWTFSAGASNEATGYNSTVLGRENSVLDYFSTAIGYRDTTLEDYNNAIGVGTKTSLAWAQAIGKDAKALGTRSMAIGDDAIAHRERAFAIGQGVEAQSYNEIAIGAYNTIYSPIAPYSWSPSQRLFTIGNGQHDTLRSDAMVILKNGLVGIGTSEPTSKFHLLKNSSDTAAHMLSIQHESLSAEINFDAFQIDQYGNDLALNSSGHPVAIGTFSVATDHRLNVGGKVIVEEARTENYFSWPDYVFHEDYALPNAEKLEKYIQQNRHLPAIPSADDIAETGLDLSNMTASLLQKVEELTLLIIDMEKKIMALEAEQNQKPVTK